MMDFSIIFPGQGSQSVGMLAELASESPLVQETFGQASEILGY
ncbi:MAG: malonyl CoA-acyl carrier protein transacylase, partial [Gammaproteobacteria bacterium]